MTRGVEDTASEQGFSVMFCNTDESQIEETEYLNILLQKQVDGVLLVPACSSGESVSLLQERGTPVVVLDRRVPDVKVDTVRCDSERGAYQLVQHLLELGHTHIAILTGPQTVSTAADRVTGYRQAMLEAGLDCGQGRVFYGEFTQEGGYQTARQALAVKPRPTALVAANNFIAIGAFHALREAGLRVPEDMSMVAFDDLPVMLITEPFLTVAAQPAYEMGQRATELLLARLAGVGPADQHELVLPIQLVIRKSSGPPPAVSCG
jgi:LacI family transcriptional regulator